jgi:hypothetical protein
MFIVLARVILKNEIKMLPSWLIGQQKRADVTSPAISIHPIVGLFAVSLQLMLAVSGRRRN